MMNAHCRVILFCLVLCMICLILLITGCAYRHAVAGQGLDLATTAIGLNNGCSEAGISGDNLLVLAAIKVGVCGLVYWLDDARVNAFAATIGYGSAAWNVGVIMEHEK
jgi:hypothetical protein